MFHLKKIYTKEIVEKEEVKEEPVIIAKKHIPKEFQIMMNTSIELRKKESLTLDDHKEIHETHEHMCNLRVEYNKEMAEKANLINKL